MRVIITGADGQLGHALRDRLPIGVEARFCNRSELDITNKNAAIHMVTSFNPNWIINAAAYTHVDNAEETPEQAHSINALGAQNLAIAALQASSRMMQISSDYVFDGRSSHPIAPSDPTRPINSYGRSKLEGERMVQNILMDDVLVLRTSWIYSWYGNNFVKTLLRLAKQKEILRVVADQISAPTYAGDLAEVIWSFASREITGINHWHDAGVASWYDFAVAIVEEGHALGLLQRQPVVEPITSADYPQAAQRPCFSLMDITESCESLDRFPLHWRTALRGMLREIKTDD